MELSLKQSAIHYYNLGLNVTHIVPQQIINENFKSEFTLKEPSHRYNQLQFRRQDYNTMLSYDWEQASGVGAVMGFKQIRSIDIDGCNKIDFIHTFLQNIGLPKDYEWLIKTGSGNGFQIIVFAHDHPYEAPKGKVVSLTPKRQYKSKFEHLELIWSNHVVLPPSKHASGKKYEFVSGRMPVYPPQKVNKNALHKFIEKICQTHGDQDSKSTHLENFLSDEYAFKSKFMSYGSHLSAYYKSPFYFFIDIKTNEIPDLNKQHPEDPEALPEIIQIATLVCDGLGKRVSHSDFLFITDGWKVKREVRDFMRLSEIKKRSNSIRAKRTEYYYINHETNQEEPEPAKRYIEYRYDLLYNQLYSLFGIFNSEYDVRRIIGHNLDYQLNCLKGLIIRNDKKSGYNEFNTLLEGMAGRKLKDTAMRICMMKNTKSFCGNKNNYEDQNPELKDLYFKLFNEEMVGVNDAKSDVYNLAKCYWKLKEVYQIEQ